MSYQTDPTQFAHLHVHDEYSLLDGFATVPEYVEVALKQKWKHVAITNHGQMGGIPKQFKACDGKLVAIFGCEVYVNDHIYNRHYALKEHDKTPLPDGYDDLLTLRELLKRNYHLTLLAKNPTGFQNLINITSEAWINGFYRRPHTTRAIIEKYKDGLIAGTACMSGMVSKNILDDNIPLAKEHLLWFYNTFKEDFFVEIMLLDIEGHDNINTGLINLMIECGISPEEHLVITNDSHYANKNDSFFQNVMLLLQRRQTFNDKRDVTKDVFQFDSLDLWYKTVPELDETYLALCKKYPKFGKAFTYDLYRHAKLNTVKFASRCERQIEKDGNISSTCIEIDRSLKFPKYCPPENEKEIYNEQYKRDSDSYLRDLTFQGLKERGLEGDEYLKRVEHEISVIKSKNFSDYFLIVRDIVRFARENNIVVGPGRGSAAGSLLSYCLGITDVDPIKHRLFFERFLNEGRKDFPDIDIDFAPEGRDKIKQYIVNHYDNNGVKADLEQKLISGFYNNKPKIKKQVQTILENDLELPESLREKRTCFIGTYGSFQTKSTILDVCRTYNVPLHIARMISKQLLADIDDMTIDEIFSVPEYKRVLSLLDVKNKNKHEYFYAEPNDMPYSQISKLSLINNINGVTKENVDEIWKALVDEEIIDNDGLVLKTPELEDLPVQDEFQSDLRSLLVHANFVTPLECVWKIRNRQKNISQHAAGVIISCVDLKKNLPLMTKGDLVLSAWIEGLKATELAMFGYIKWDILGLQNLVFIDNTIKLIKERYKDKPFKRFKSNTGNKLVKIQNVNLQFIDSNLNDPEVYKELRQGRSALIFQFESPLMRKLLKDSDCDNFECLTAITALGRPGPLQSGMTEEFCLRKLGLKEYEIHPVLQKALDYSYGIVIYQEQIMQIVNILAGYSLAETDNFRKILIKFRRDVVDETAEKMKKYKEQFITGGSKYMSVEELEKLFTDFEKWAGYGFNRSHAVSYTIVSYRCAWLKTYFPLEYICSVLQSTTKGDIIKKGKKTNKYQDYIHEAQRLGIKILKVDINTSCENFSIVDETTIQIGFSNIKGITEKSSKTIAEVRPFNDFQEFLKKTKLNKRVLVPLILIGAFDNLPKSIGRVEAYLHCAKHKKFDLGKDYNQFLRNSDKDDMMSKKMLKILEGIAVYFNVKIENMTPKFVKDLDLDTLNFGRVGSSAFTQDIFDKLVEKNYIDENGRINEYDVLDIGLPEDETIKIHDRLQRINKSKIELTKEEQDLFFTDVFGFSLNHYALDKKVGIAKQMFESKMQVILNITDNITNNALKKISEIKECGEGRGIGLIVDFEERQTKNGDTYCVIILEDGFGEENQIRIFCWSESYRQYGKLLDIRDPKNSNRIKIKDRIVYFDVMQDKVFHTFTPRGCPSFFKFSSNDVELGKDALMFITALRDLKDIRIEKGAKFSVQDVIGYKLDIESEEDDEETGLTRFVDETDHGEQVEGIYVGEHAQIIGYISGIRECETESKKKHPDIRIKKIVKWIDLTIGDYTGSFDIKVWKSIDYIGEEEILDQYDFSKSSGERNQDAIYNDVLRLKTGMLVKVVVERLPDYKILFGENKVEILKKTFLLKRILKIKDTLRLLKNYEKI